MSYIVKQKADQGRICVHLAENHYRPELKQARQTRRHLGVLDKESGELRLASGLPEPDRTLLALLAKAGVEYHGKKASSRGRIPSGVTLHKARLTLEDRACRMEEVGEAYVMGMLARESGLEAALCGALGEREGLALLWVAMHQACTAQPQYLASEWLEERCLPQILEKFDFSSSGLSNFSEALGHSMTCRGRFLQRWIEACGKPEAIILDTTSLSTYSECLEMAEWGYNRDHESLPQVNFSLAIGASEGHLPLAFRTHFGSVPDVATLEATSEFLREYGMEQISYSTDKGFWSHSNTVEMIGRKMQFVMGVPQTSQQAKALVHKHRRKLDSMKNSLLYGEHIVRQAQDQWSVSLPDGTTALLDAFVFMEPRRVSDRVIEFERRVLELERQVEKKSFPSLAEARQWLKENAKSWASCLSIVRQKKGFRITRNPLSTARKCKVAGVSLYATNRSGLDASSVLSIVRGRDAIEKVFDIIKNEDGQNRLRTGNTDRVEGRLWLAFVAAILRILLENRMREGELLKQISVAEALVRLRKIKRIRFESGRCQWLEIPKRTRKLLEALKISLPQ
jgi:transposase